MACVGFGLLAWLAVGAWCGGGGACVANSCWLCWLLVGYELVQAVVCGLCIPRGKTGTNAVRSKLWASARERLTVDGFELSGENFNVDFGGKIRDLT
jgi:hypothetical protein